MTLQQDGKIVVAGTAGDDFVLVRYLPDGSRDAGFGSGGRAGAAARGAGVGAGSGGGGAGGATAAGSSTMPVAKPSSSFGASRPSPCAAGR